MDQVRLLQSLSKAFGFEPRVRINKELGKHLCFSKLFFIRAWGECPALVGESEAFGYGERLKAQRAALKSNDVSEMKRIGIEVALGRIYAASRVSPEAVFLYILS